MKKGVKKLAPILLAAGLLFLTACGESGTTSGGPVGSTGDASNTSQGATAGFTVKYDGGDGAIGTAPKERDDVQADETIALAANPFVKDGYVFDGWTDGEKVYQPADFYKVSGDVTFTAQWKQSDGKFYICDGEDLGSWTPAKSHTLTVKRSGAKQGNGYFEATGRSDIVIENWAADLNIEPYLQSGTLHMWLYVSKASSVTGGQLEFTSSGHPDEEELHLGEFNIQYPLKDGWNELEIPLKDLAEQGGTCYPDSITCIRFYLNNSEQLTVGLDDMYLVK